MSDSESDYEDSSIGEILRRIGCGEYVPAFEAQKTCDLCAEHRVGVNQPIPQIGHPQSRVVNKFVELSQPKKKKGIRNAKRNGNRNEKTTRRLYIGWKHKANAGTFKVVSASKGGGMQILDIRKDSSYPEIVKLIFDCYFPKGYSKWQNLNINDLIYFVGNFTGEPLPTSERGFTLSEYLSQQSSSPVRLYLHTQTVNEVQGPLQTLADDQMYDSSESLPSLADIMSTNTVSCGATVNMPGVFTAQLPPPSAVVTAQLPPPSAVVTAQLPPPSAVVTAQLPSPSAVVTAQLPPPPAVVTAQLPPPPAMVTAQLPSPSAVVTSSSLPASVGAQFITDSGTPEVTFHHRLSLRHRAEYVSRPSSSSQREVIDVVDTDDEELEMAIQASLQDYKAPHLQETEQKSLDEILTEIYDRWVTDQMQTIIVSRRNVLDSAYRALERKSFLIHGKPYVKFSGEIGEDCGGPRREFFRLALNELQCSQLFCGSETKYLTHDVDLLEKGRFRLAGQLIALSFIHDGPSPHFLDPTVFDLMLGGEANMEKFNRSSLPIDVRDILKQLTDVESVESANLFIQNNGDWLCEHGFNNIWGFRPDDKDIVCNQIVKQIVYYRCAAEITEFIRGMNEVGHFWDVVKEHPDEFRPEFCDRVVPLTMESFQSICKVDFSVEGSNSRQRESDTIYAWELFLQDIEDQCVDVSFGELLSFITGTDHIPPRGFQRKIDIQFYTSETGTKRLPSASTCALVLYLPRDITNPDEFKTVMLRSLKESQGFHKI